MNVIQYHNKKINNNQEIKCGSSDADKAFEAGLTKYLEQQRYKGISVSWSRKTEDDSSDRYTIQQLLTLTYYH